MALSVLNRHRCMGLINGNNGGSKRPKIMLLTVISVDYL